MVKHVQEVLTHQSEYGSRLLGHTVYYGAYFLGFIPQKTVIQTETGRRVPEQ